MSLKRIVRIVCLLVAGVAVLAISATAQSDSDLVRAAKAKSTAQKAKHVYTDADFPDKPEAAPAEPATESTGGVAKTPDSSDSKAADASAAGGQADAAKTSGDKPGAGTDAKANDKNKVKDLQDKLEEAKKGEADLQRKLDTLDEKAKNEKDEFRKNMYLDMVSNQQSTLSDYRRKEEQLQKQIDERKSEEKTDNKEPQ